jgi:hypothetical protein
MDIKSLASKKVAGVPVIWVLAIVAGIGLFSALRLKPQTGETTEPLEDAPEGDPTDTQQPVFIANTPPVVNEQIDVDENNQGDTNEAWGRRAISYLNSTGASPSLSSSAISKYLSEETLSYAEGLLRDKAVTQLGIPPEGILRTSTGGYKGPASAQGTPPTTHTVKGASDNTFKELARLYYGLDSADATNTLRAANASKLEPFISGARITIPKFNRPRYYRATSATRTIFAIASKNATTPAAISQLNPGITFPVKPGIRVRVK